MRNALMGCSVLRSAKGICLQLRISLCRVDVIAIESTASDPSKEATVFKHSIAVRPSPIRRDHSEIELKRIRQRSDPLCPSWVFADNHGIFPAYDMRPYPTCDERLRV